MAIYKFNNNDVLSSESILHEFKTDSSKKLLSEIINELSNNKDVYSYNETLTNKVWVDGKPIYRKVIDCGNMPSNSTNKVVNHNISNIDEIISCIGRATNDSCYFNMPYHGTINAFQNAPFQIRGFKDHIDIGTASTNYTHYQVLCILEYTKN